MWSKRPHLKDKDMRGLAKRAPNLDRASPEMRLNHRRRYPFSTQCWGSQFAILFLPRACTSVLKICSGDAKHFVCIRVESYCSAGSWARILINFMMRGWTANPGKVKREVSPWISPPSLCLPVLESANPRALCRSQWSEIAVAPQRLIFYTVKKVFMPLWTYSEPEWIGRQKPSSEAVQKGRRYKYVEAAGSLHSSDPVTTATMTWERGEL